MATELAAVAVMGERHSSELIIQFDKSDDHKGYVPFV